jgi:uncharacterized membrane protein YhfC
MGTNAHQISILIDATKHVVYLIQKAKNTGQSQDRPQTYILSGKIKIMLVLGFGLEI